MVFYILSVSIIYIVFRGKKFTMFLLESKCIDLEHVKGKLVVNRRWDQQQQYGQIPPSYHELANEFNLLLSLPSAYFA